MPPGGSCHWKLREPARLTRPHPGHGREPAVLGRVAELARQTLPGMAGASVTLVESDRTFAGYAAVAIANVRLYQSTATLAEDMRRAMESRAVIEQAKGILVAQQHCTPEQAFELLTRLSQTTHRKLRDCAADLVTSTAEDRPAE
jgi:ANTAR domain